MASTEPDIGEYNEALVAALRTGQPAVLRQFAQIWGDRLGNRGLKQLAKAADEVVEERLWMMVYDRQDLVDLHLRALEWLERHGKETPK
jgi:hypothetical protein